MKSSNLKNVPIAVNRPSLNPRDPVKDVIGSAKRSEQARQVKITLPPPPQW